MTHQPRRLWEPRPAVRYASRGPAAPPRGLWLGVTVAAVVLRAGLLAAPLMPTPPIPVFAGMLYPGDHDDFVRWGLQAQDRGLLSLYTEPPHRQNLRSWDKAKHTWHISQRKFDRVCNYPPLSVYLLAVSGAAFSALRPDRLLNTVESLSCFTFWSILGDFLTAWGCAALVRRFRPGWAPLWVYVAALFLPILWWDSVIWAQTDSILLAAVVWMLHAMLHERWVLAGVLWGVAFALKTQAVLFIPLWGYALLTTRPFWKPLVGGVAALDVLLLMALPFTLHSGWAWYLRSYHENLFAIYSNLTTLKAFNIWYLHLLLTDSLDAHAKWLGLTRGMWSKIWLVLALLAGLLFMLWRWRRDSRGLVLWTTLSLLLFMMIPTEVHERYLILVLPFLGVAVAFAPRLWPGLLLLLVVMLGQLSWPLWLPSGRGGWDAMAARVTHEYNAQLARWPADRGPPPVSLEENLADVRETYRQQRAQTAAAEWTFTVCALVGTAATLAALLTLRPNPPDAVQIGAARSARVR